MWMESKNTGILQKELRMRVQTGDQGFEAASKGGWRGRDGGGENSLSEWRLIENGGLQELKNVEGSLAK